MCMVSIVLIYLKWKNIIFVQVCSCQNDYYDSQSSLQIQGVALLDDGTSHANWLHALWGILPTTYIPYVDYSSLESTN